MKKVLFLSNIPTPYRNEFYNELGKSVDLTVVYEAKGARDQGIRFNWDINQVLNYKAIFLKDGDIEEKKINWAIFSELRKKYDIIIATNYSYLTEMTAILYLKIKKIPYYLEIDGGIIRKENRIKRLFKTFLITGARKYFSPSTKTDEFLVHYGATENAIIRHPFTSLHCDQVLIKPLTKEQKRQVRATLGIQDDRVVLGVGQLIQRKGWDMLLDVAHKIEAGIYIVGEGELRSQYEAKIRERNLKNVHLIGFQDNETTAAYYKAADLFVLPTRYDIWGLVINEALAYGLPTITTSKCIAGIELIKNGTNGFIVDVEDTYELYKNIEKVLNEPAFALSLSESAIDTMKNYTIEEMASKHIAEIEKGY